MTLFLVIMVILLVYVSVKDIVEGYRRRSKPRRPFIKYNTEIVERAIGNSFLTIGEIEYRVHMMFDLDLNRLQIKSALQNIAKRGRLSRRCYEGHVEYGIKY